MEISQILPIIALILGIVITQLFNFLWHWLKRREQEKDAYRKLLKDYLKDYLAPLFKTVFSIVNLLKIEKSNVEESLKKLNDELESVFYDNLGIFGFILPFDMIRFVFYLRRDIRNFLDSLKENEKHSDLISKITNDGINILDGFRKIFGVEHIEKLDKEFKEFVQEIKKENTEK